MHIPTCIHIIKDKIKLKIICIIGCFIYEYIYAMYSYVSNNICQIWMLKAEIKSRYMLIISVIGKLK